MEKQILKIASSKDIENMFFTLGKKLQDIDDFLTSLSVQVDDVNRNLRAFEERVTYNDYFEDLKPNELNAER